MDPLSIIIVGAVVAAAPVAHGAGVPAPIVEQVVQSARTDLPALTEQLSRPAAVRRSGGSRGGGASGAVAGRGDSADRRSVTSRRQGRDRRCATATTDRGAGSCLAGVASPTDCSGPGAEPTTAGSAQFSPGALSPFVPQGVTSVPSPLLVIPGLGGSALPPAVIPGLTLQAIPAAFLPALHSAAGVCPQVGAPVLAAQLWAENGFRYGLRVRCRRRVRWVRRSSCRRPGRVGAGLFR